jgi:thiamine-monophosphate kinase
MSSSEPSSVRGEADIIAMLAPLAESMPGAFGLMDDCALITPEAGSELVLKTDPIAEGVHFLPDDAPEDIAWKALAVNVSDLAAKAARPIGYLMALAFPEAPTTAWMARFAAGLRQAQQRFGCALIGGDTDRRPGPLTISITILGAVAHGRMVRRGTARPGHKMFVSGTLGDAALGLGLRKTPGLAGAWGLSAADADHLRRRYARPEPRLALSSALLACASAAMDISDGLAKDVARMCSASACGGRLQAAAIPLSAACARALDAQPALIAQVVTGGDDYEILAAVPAGQATAFRTAAAAAEVVVTEIGGFLEGRGIVIDGADGRPLGLAKSGFDHFA